MRAAWSIAKRDIRAFFASPVAYVVLVVWLLWGGGTFYLLTEFYASQSFSAGSENPLTAFFGGTILFYLPFLVFVPVLTMRLFAAERASGTLEALLTAPVRASSVVLGKYLAAMTFWVALWVPTFLYVWIISRYGDVDLGAIAASYLGVFGIGAFYMALGLLMSSIAPNQIVGAILGFMVLGALFVAGLGQFVVQDETRDVLGYLSVWSHMNDFSKGVVDTRYLVFDASMTVLALVLTVAAPLSELPRRRVQPVVLVFLMVAFTVVAATFGADTPMLMPTIAAVVLLLTAAAVWAKIRSEKAEEEDEASKIRAESRLHGHVGALLMTLIVLQVNYLGFRHFERFDWTEEQRFTLSERSLEVARRLEQDVEMILFLGSSEPSFGDLEELLKRYEAVSPRLHTTYVDPDAQPGELRRLAERYDIPLASSAEGVTVATIAAVVVSGEKRWRISRDDLISVDMDSLGDSDGPKIDVKAERALTGALLQVTRGRPTRLCIAQGYGEYSADGGQRSIYNLREELTQENIEVESLDVVGIAAVPDDCDAVWVLGPQRTYAGRDARVLFDYLRDGGNLLLALDPLMQREQVLPSGFEEVAAELGVLIDQDVVLEMDPQRLLSSDPTETFIANDWGNHALLGPLRAMGGVAALEFVRSVRAEEGSGAEVLLQASPDSFGETNIAQLIADRELVPGSEDVPGPVGLAVAVQAPRPPLPGAQPGAEQSAPGGRLVVVGDSDWLRMSFLGEPQFANLDFAMATTGWLTERDAMISIAPRRSQMRSVVMTEDDVGGIAVRVFLLLPGAFLLIGFATWWSRRR